MKFLILSVLLSSWYLVSCDNRTPGYYWRDYYDHVPQDAFAVSKDRYIAQVLTHHNHALVPAQFNPHYFHATYAYEGHPYMTKDNFKVFSTSDANQFEWITTNNDDIQKLGLERQLIPAGYDNKYQLYVGKSLEGGFVGSVSINPVWAGLVYVDDNYVYHHDHEFQVLAYKVL